MLPFIHNWGKSERVHIHLYLQKGHGKNLSDRDLASRIYKFSQLNNKKTMQFKDGQRT